MVHIKLMLKIQVIILILITNFAFGQEYKVIVDQKIGKYEQVDEFYNFDDIKANLKAGYIKKKEFRIVFKSESEIQLINIYNSGYVGAKISIKINQQLEIIDAIFNTWSDVIDLENQIKQKVTKIDLKLNQNPFSDIQGLRGEYIMEIQNTDKPN